MKFEQLNIIEPILKAIQEKGYVTPSPIQQQAIPIVMKGHDLFGCAQTGTGKTAAFAIPILQLIHNQNRSPKHKKIIKALVLTPTRELAIQIGENFTEYGKYLNLKNTVIFGGVGQGIQVKTLNRGVDILVATPGRLLDLMGQNLVDLRSLDVLVLDEADRMLDMGFIHDVKKILSKISETRQTLFFSATMPPAILKLAEQILVNPEKVEITPVSSTVETVGQSVYFVEKNEKKDLLVHLLKDNLIKSVLVFSRTKHGANKIVTMLQNAGITSAAIHGNKSQTARQLALSKFKSRKIRALVATDIAARGIDIDELSHVINYDIPNEPETYVHRIGRTGRAGASGIAISFCDNQEKSYLKNIIRLIKKDIPVRVNKFPVSFQNGKQNIKNNTNSHPHR